MLWILLVVLLAWIAFGPWVLVAAAAALLVPRVRWWCQDRLWITRRGVGIAAAAVVLLSALVVVVPDGWVPIPQAPGVLATPAYVGRPADPRPVAAQEVPAHPHLARNGASTMHNDAWASDAYSWAGPLGEQPQVETAWFGLEECAGLAIDSRGRLVGVCQDRSGPELHVIDPESMRKLASKDLPDRPEGHDAAWNALCAGAYFYLDPQDRAVVATHTRKVLAIRTADGEGDAELSTDQSWDLTPYVPDGDCLVSVVPDWAGRIWWVSQAGLVGTIDPGSGAVAVHDLDAEVANAMAVDEDGGVYVVTVKALQRLAAGADGTPQVIWSTPYDRGKERKPGQHSRGSGTTPTLLDDRLVAIADNADGRMNVVFHDRTTGEEVCRQPVFEVDASATASSLVSVGRGVVVENNHDYTGVLSTALGRSTSPGLARVDVVDGECTLRWTTEVSAPSSVAKVSWANGLLYAYTKRSTWTGVSSWYVSALDVETGRVVWAVRTGTGMLMNNHHAALTLAPGGSLYVATLAGIVRVRDRD